MQLHTEGLKDVPVWDARRGCLNANDLVRAVAALRSGEPIIFPTETVYGLAVDAWNGEALDRAVLLKQRDVSKGLPIQIAASDALETLLDGPPIQSVVDLMERFWPGPLTLVFQPRPGLPRLLLGESGGVAIRIPDHPVALSLLSSWGGPLMVTSANRSGDPPATTALDALKCIGAEVAGVVDAGPSYWREASTVLDVREAPFRVLRQGALAESAIVEVTGPVTRQ